MNPIMPPKEWYENDPEAQRRWEAAVPKVLLDHQDKRAGALHRMRVVSYNDGESTYLLLEESHPGYSGFRMVEANTAIHALLNLGRMEIFEVGNRERDHTGKATPSVFEFPETAGQTEGMQYVGKTVEQVRAELELHKI